MTAELHSQHETDSGLTSQKLRAQRGVVVSNKMDKTAVVRIDWRVRHPLYGKTMTRSTRLSIHDAENQCQEGDIVLVKECRPISKTKAWTLVEVLETAR